MGLWDKLFKNEADDAARFLKKIASDAAGGVAGGTASYLTQKELHKKFDANTNVKPPETWTQVSRDPRGWVYLQSSYGKRIARNVYTGQQVNW
jgi:hypothetical protein